MHPLQFMFDLISPIPRPKTATRQIEDTGTYYPYSFRTMPRVLFKNYVWGWRRQGQRLNVLGQWHDSLHLERIFHRYPLWVPETFWLRPTAEDVLAFGPHRKSPPHARKTSGTQVTDTMTYVTRFLGPTVVIRPWFELTASSPLAGHQHFFEWAIIQVAVNNIK